MRAGTRFRTVAIEDSRVGSPEASTPPTHDVSKAIIAWVLVISAVIALPWSGQIMRISSDALDRATAAASELLKSDRAATAAIPETAGAAPAVQAAAPSVRAPNTVPARNAPAAAPQKTNAPATAPNPATATQPTGVRPTTPGQPVSPITQPIAPAQPVVTAAPFVGPQATTAPTTAPAPTAAPTAAPSVAPVTLPGVAVAAPNAPRAYSVPANAVQVATSGQLLTALAKSTASDIALADGVYDNAVPFQNNYGHRMYSAHLGGAVFKAGLVLGGGFGPGRGLVQGVTFDVSSPAKALLNGVIHVWGTGAGSQILDSTFNGHNVIGSGIHIVRPDGNVVRRVVVRNFTDFGVFADASTRDLVLSTPIILEDLDVANVGRAVARSSNGTSEACVWLGNTGTMRRVKVRDCAWMGIWTGTANKNALHEDLDVDRTPVGIYLEHFTVGSVFQKMRVGTSVRRGVICEWADPDWGGRPGCTDVIIQDSSFATSEVGVQFGVGTTRTTVRRNIFIGQTLAGVNDSQGGINNSYYENDYSKMAPSAVPVSFAILNW